MTSDATCSIEALLSLSTGVITLNPTIVYERGALLFSLFCTWGVEGMCPMSVSSKCEICTQAMSFQSLESS